MTAAIIKKDEQVYDKVIALTDLEICQQLATIEGLQTYIQFDSVRVQVTDGDDYYLNPLENSDQLINLMIKHEVQRNWEPYDFIGWGYHVVDGKNPIHILERQNFDGSDTADLPMSKAVCLAIILNKSKDFKLN